MNATAPGPASPPRLDAQERQRFQVTPYDRASSLLIAMLILVGLSVVGMFAIWLTNRVYVPNVTVPVETENVGGSEDGSLGEGQELGVPEEEMLAETDLAEPQLQETVAMITDALADQLANLDDPLLNAELEASARQQGDRKGSSAPLGSGEGTGGGFARAQRWRIQFDNTTLSAYARQLDAFGIELAAIRPGRVEYAWGFSGGGKPQRRVAEADAQEERLYMSWQGGTLQQFDMQLLQAAGIDPRGKIVVQFYPEAVENRLAQLERSFANREANQIRRTTFGIRMTNGQADFYVISQEPL